jgi:hypothetical protein
MTIGIISNKVRNLKIGKTIGIISAIVGIAVGMIAVQNWITDRPKIEIKLKIDPVVIKTPDESLKNKDVFERFVYDLVVTIFREHITDYLERHKLPSKEFEKNVLETKKQLIERLTGMTVCFPYKVSIMNNGTRDTTILSARLTVDAVIDTNINILTITLATNESIPAGSLSEYNGTLDFRLKPDPKYSENPLDTWVDESVCFWLNYEELPPEILRYELEGESVDYVFKFTCEDQYGNRTSKKLTTNQISFMHLNQSYKMKDSPQWGQQEK